MSLLKKGRIDPYYFRKNILSIDTEVDNEDKFVPPYLREVTHFLFATLEALHIYYEDNTAGVLALNPEFDVWNKYLKNGLD